MNKNLWLLAVCQGLFLTNNVTFIAINGLVGLSLAPLGWMATLPVMGYVVGGALSTSLVAKTQTRYGRKRSFQLGLVVAFLLGLSVLYSTAQFARLGDPYFRGVILASVAIAVVSFIDDIRDWPFTVKLAAQVGAALTAVGSGLYVSVYNLPVLAEAQPHIDHGIDDRDTFNRLHERLVDLELVDRELP